jgi:GT2 family glycosyltransferase
MIVMKNNSLSKNIQAVVVNHNTSRYTELLLRSMFARHTDELDMSVIVYDNNSLDDRGGLEAFASAKGIPILPSGFEIKTKWNSHGEVLSRFVQEHPESCFLLFLDTDVCFLEDGTLDLMLEELQRDKTAFAISPRITSNADSEIEREHWPVVYGSRLHPCCALVKNTATFQRVVAEVGLSCVQFLWAHGEEYFDTFRLMTHVMKTHGFRVIHSAAMVQHFFCVSYELEPEKIMNAKARLRDKLLEGYLCKEEPVPTTRT